MDNVLLIVKSTAQPGARDQVRQLYEDQLAPRALNNAAQQVVIWAADATDPDAFYLVEVYRDRAAMEANAQAPWFWAYMEAAGPLLAGQPEVITASPAWAKGLAG
jgi:quinol monooxygenase YgiN